MGDAAAARWRARATRALGDRNLVLVGFMGTGKSTVGRATARVLGRPFADSDAETEARAGCTVAELFARLGEAGFRSLERAVVADLASRRGWVLATGGGALANPGSLEALRANGVLLALSARPEVILRRVGGAAAGSRRPLLAGPDPLGRIASLLEERAAVYGQADLQLDTSGCGRGAAVETVLRLVAERAGCVRRGAGR